MSTLSILVLFYIIAKLSERFGSVLKMPPLYKWFYLSEALTLVALVAHLIQAGNFLATPQNRAVRVMSLPFALVFYHLPLTIAVTLGLFITWKYWGWLITEQKK